MKKIPSLYVRNPQDMAHVTREVNACCQWVIDGEGEATVKYDGTCVMLDIHGQWWARHQVRPDKQIPENYIPVEHDPVTGKTQGWIPMKDSQYREFHREAVERRAVYTDPTPGTFELIGPKIGGNPHKERGHLLLRHGSTSLPNVPTEYGELSLYLRDSQDDWGGFLEGIVWHHPDGRMAKIKTRDFPDPAEQRGY